MQSFADAQLLALTATSPDAFAVFYGRHEPAMLRFFMERVRAPDLAADLTAETFASALAQAARFDPARQPAPEWLLALANAQLLRADRVGTIDHAARARLKTQPVTLDNRALDRVWNLRGPDRAPERKPHRSPGIVVAEAPTIAMGGDDDRARGGVPIASAAAHGAAVHAATRGAAPLLPAVADSLVAAASRGRDRRRRRRRVLVGARVAVALVTVAWVVGAAVVPDRPASAASAGGWVPFVAPHGVAGFYPRLWYVASTPQAPPIGERELVTITTYPTGLDTDAKCGSLKTLGDADALVAVFQEAGGSEPHPDRPDRFENRRSAALEHHLRRCRPGIEVSRIPFRDDDRRLDALLVLGPSASRETEALALETLDRVRLEDF